MKRSRLLSLICLLALAMTLPAAPPGFIKVSWAPSPDPSVTGYYLAWGTHSGQETNIIDVGNTNTCTISNLTSGIDYYIVTRAYNSKRRMSPNSNELIGHVPLPSSSTTATGPH